MSVKSGTAYLFAATLALAPSVAFAGTVVTPAAKAPLAPGGAAGVKQAESLSDNTLATVAGGAIVVGGLVLVLSGGHGSTTTTTTAKP